MITEPLCERCLHSRRSFNSLVCVNPKNGTDGPDNTRVTTRPCALERAGNFLSRCGRPGRWFEPRKDPQTLWERIREVFRD